MTEIEALRAEIKRLRARVAELERRLMPLDVVGKSYVMQHDSLRDRLNRGGVHNS